MNTEINKDFLQEDPFNFPGLHVIRERNESMKLKENKETKVIIAGGGMMTGGRIVEHARHYLPLPNTRLLIVGYQGEGTLGRELLMGEKNVTIRNQLIHVNATVSDTQVMSSHADQAQLMTWLKSIKNVRKVILTHGEDGPRKVLADKIKAETAVSAVEMPMLNQELVI